MDAVTSLGGTHVDVDKTASTPVSAEPKKCLSVPPGLAPVTMNSAEKCWNRKSPVQSWYLDLSMIRKLGTGEVHYHTAPISMIFALGSPGDAGEEGLENAIKRHQELGLYCKRVWKKWA